MAQPHTHAKIHVPQTSWDTPNHGKSWAPQRDDLRRLFEDGYSIAQISQALGRAGDAVVSKLCAMGLVRFDVLTGEYHSVPRPTAPATPKEPAMTAITKIESKTFIDGKDAATLTDDQLFERIERMELQIKRWEGISAKPKKLIARIEEARGAIAALVAYIDQRDVLSPNEGLCP